MSKTVIRWIPDCNVCGLPLYERTSTTGGVCRGHPNIEDELDDILKQFDIDAVADYWKALSDKWLELLKRADKYAKKTGKCLFCRMRGDDKIDDWQHDPDCELAEAIEEMT